MPGVNEGVFGTSMHPLDRPIWSALTTRQLQRISFNQPSQAERREPLLLPLNIRVRDVQQSPDGYIYVATEQGSRGDTSDGTVLRIELVK